MGDRSSLECACAVLLALGACRGPVTRQVTQPFVPADYVVTTSVDAASAAFDLQGGEPPVGAVDPRAAVVEFAPQGGQGPDDAEDLGRARSEFGSHVVVRPDGKITKQYFVSAASGQVLLNLLTEPGAAKPPANQKFVVGAEEAPASTSILGRQLAPHEVEFLYLDNFEHPAAVNVRSTVNETIPAVSNWPANSLLLVTADADGLRAFEAGLNLFFTNVPQVEIDVKVVEYSTDDFLGIGIDAFRDGSGNALGPSLQNSSTGQLVQNVIGRFPLSPSLTGAGSSSDVGLISLGGIHDSWELNAQLQLLEARGAADVVSNPRLTVRNGGLASVTLTTDIPYPQARITSTGNNVTANIVFRPVGINLNIRPVIAGTETVILQVFASVSAVTSFAGTSPVPTPIISSREAVTSVHLSDGKTTVIGGLVSQSSFQSETKFPILGDIPVLGYLFRSTSDQTQRTTVEFHITPTIILGSAGISGLGGG